MHAKGYQSALDWLFKQFPSYQLIGSKAYKPTLQNIERICELIGDPQNNLRFIHIAGTNGKGSCSSMTASILTETGLRTGLFTSPHIADFRERIRVNGEMIAEKDVIAFIDKIKTLSLDFEPSFFEITFAMALQYFALSGCEICVIETGLGGRLDATNIIHPVACLITNISLEHTAILGDTVEAIAGEKAGIIKKDTPVVIGEWTNDTRPVFERFAANNNAPIRFAETEILDTTIDRYKLPLLGAFQRKNLRSVLSLLEVLDIEIGVIDATTIQKGLDRIYQNTGFFGRMHIMERDPLLLFDVSHNDAGMKATLETVQQINSGKLHILYGASSDKDVNTCVRLFPKDAAVTLTVFSGQRSMKRDRLERLKIEEDLTASIFDDAHKALLSVRREAAVNDTILVTGSFFLLSDLLDKKTQKKPSGDRKTSSGK